MGLATQVITFLLLFSNRNITFNLKLKSGPRTYKANQYEPYLYTLNKTIFIVIRLDSLPNYVLDIEDGFKDSISSEVITDLTGDAILKIDGKMKEATCLFLL